MSDYSFKSCAKTQLENFIKFNQGADAWNHEYEKLTRRFDVFIVENFPDSTELTQEIFNKWFQKVNTENCNSTYKRTCPARRFIKYLNGHGFNFSIPEIQSYFVEKPKPYPMTEDEIRRFFYCCDHISEEYRHDWYKNRKQSKILRITAPVLFRLLYSSGIRPPEVRWLKVEHVDLEKGILNIQRTKGHDQHYVALHPSMTELLKKFDRAISKIVKDRKYFFSNMYGCCLSPAWIDYNFKKCWLKANGNIKAVTYDFRHNYAIANINSWSQEKNNIYDCFDKIVYLSKSMGHASINSTLYYYSLTPQFADVLENKCSINFDELIREEFLDES